LKQNEKELKKMRKKFEQEKKDNQDKLDQMQVSYNTQQESNKRVMELCQSQMLEMQNTISNLQNRNPEQVVEYRICILQ